jgi:arsenite-transporting ATPase
MPDALPAVLADPPPLLLVGGKGGVGKTTCATAAALHLVEHRPGPVRLLSTDPAHSLRDRLPPAERPDALAVEEFDAATALDHFRSEHRETLHDIVARGTFFDDADIQELLDLSLPGLDETMGVLRLEQALTADPEGPVVVDTAPTGHTLRLLEMPERFEAWVAFLDVLLEKDRLLRERFGGGGESALDAFVNDLQARAERVLEGLRTQAAVLAVAQPEAVVLRETKRLLDRLDALGVPVGAVGLNRWPGRPLPPHCADALRAHHDWLAAEDAWTLPEAEALDTHEALAALWASARPLPAPDSLAEAPARARDAAPLVADAPPPPTADLLLFAGKGGVGKTTLACATALRLAQDAPDEQVLLLTTDPAASLGDVLGVSIDDAPTPIADGLDALRVEAPARLHRLQTAYTDEVRQFFQDTGGARVDLPHAQAVSEHLMDLVPPGVDEIVGLTMTMEQLADDRYDRLVLDTAPTGHFLRFLDMPDVFEAWLHTFFRLLRKYRRVLHVPALKDRLVRLSKQLTPLRTALTDPASAPRGAVYAVATPGPIVRSETNRLLHRCDEGGLFLPVLFLNKVSPRASVFGPGADAPEADAPEADAVVEAYRTAFPDRALPVVGRRAPPQGRASLRAWGRALYT